MDNISISVIENPVLVSISAVQSIDNVVISIGSGGTGGFAALGNTVNPGAFNSGSVMFSGANLTVNTSLTLNSQYIQISAENPNNYRYTSQDSQIQFTSANSNLINTSQSSLFRLTGNDSQLLFTSQSSLFRHTSADSQLQFTSANSNLLGSGATQSFVHTSNSSLFRHTSQNSQLQFTSAMSNYQASGNYLTTAAQSNHSHGNPTLALTNLTGTTASASNGFTISLSAANPGGGGGIAASLSGNSTSAGAGYSNITSGTMILAGGNNITLSQNGASITISGANIGGAQTGISGLAASNTTFTSGTVFVSGLNNITVSSSVNGASQYIQLSVGNYLTTAMQSNQTSNFRYTSADSQLQFTSANSNLLGSGATASLLFTSQSSLFQHTSNTSAITSNAFAASATTKFAGTGTSATNASITLNSNGLAISVAAPGGGGGAAIKGSGTYSQNTGTVEFANSNGITFGLSNNGTMTASHNGLTTAMASNEPHIRAIVYSNQTQTSGSVYFSGSNGITVRSGANTVIIEFDGHHMDALIPSGNGNGTGFSSMTSGTIGINAMGALSMSQNGNNLSLSVPSNYLTTAMQSNAGSNFVGLNSALTANGVSATINSSGVSLNFPAFLTTAMASANTSLYMSTSERNNYQYTSNSSNNTSVYLGIGNSTAYQTSVLSGTFFQTVNSSNLFPSAQTTKFAGTGTSATNASVTLNSNGLAISVAAPGAAAEANWINLQGNTASNSTASGSTIMWSAGNNITLAATNGSVIRIDAGGGGGGAALQGSGTYTQNTGTIQFSNANGVSFGLTAGTMTASVPVGTVAFSDANGITFGSSVNGVSTSISASYNSTQFAGIGTSATNASITMNSNGLAISVAAPGGGAVYTDFEWHNFTGNSTHIAPGQNSIWFQPFELRNPVSASSLQIGMTFTGTVTSAATAQFGMTQDFMLLSRNATNSTRFDSIWSTRHGFTMWNSGTSSNSWSSNGTSSSSAASNLIVTQIFGQRIISAPVNSELSAGFYMMAYRQSTSSAAYSALVRTFNCVFVAPLPQAKNFIGAQTATSIGHFIGGPYSVTSASIPVSIGQSQLRKSNDLRMFFKIGAVS